MPDKVSFMGKTYKIEHNTSKAGKDVKARKNSTKVYFNTKKKYYALFKGHHKPRVRGGAIYVIDEIDWYRPEDIGKVGDEIDLKAPGTLNLKTPPPKLEIPEWVIKGERSYIQL